MSHNKYAGVAVLRPLALLLSHTPPHLPPRQGKRLLSTHTSWGGRRATPSPVPAQTSYYVPVRGEGRPEIRGQSPYYDLPHPSIAPSWAQSSQKDLRDPLVQGNTRAACDVARPCGLRIRIMCHQEKACAAREASGWPGWYPAGAVEEG